MKRTDAPEEIKAFCLNPTTRYGKHGRSVEFHSKRVPTAWTMATQLSIGTAAKPVQSPPAVKWDTMSATACSLSLIHISEPTRPY